MAERRTDILIVGGGAGGCAEAMAETSLGNRVVMTEETDWTGGSLRVNQSAARLRENGALRRRVRSREASGAPVILHSEVGNLFLSHQPSKGVFELRLLYEEVVLRIDGRCVLRALEVERQPLLDACHAGALC